MEDFSQVHSWGKKGNLWAKELLADSTGQKCERNQWIPNSTSMVRIRQCGNFHYFPSEFWLFFLCFLSFVNHFVIFWLAGEVNLHASILDYFIMKNYLITGYVLFLPYFWFRWSQWEVSKTRKNLKKMHR